jgi:hypothetical protein
MSVAPRDPELAAWLDGHGAPLPDARLHALMQGVHARMASADTPVAPRPWLSAWTAVGSLAGVAAGVWLGIIIQPDGGMPALLLGLIVGVGG